MNDKVQYHATDAPYDGNIRIPSSAQEGDILEVTAKAIDVYGYSSTSNIELRIGDGSPTPDEDDEEEIPEDEEEAVLLEEDELILSEEEE